MLFQPSAVERQINQLLKGGLSAWKEEGRGFVCAEARFSPQTLLLPEIVGVVL